MWAWVSTKPGTMVLPVTSITRAPDGAEPRAPTLTIRLFRITTSAFSTTSLSFIVITRAPRSATVPSGISRGALKSTRRSSGR